MSTERWDILAWVAVVAFFIYCWQSDPDFLNMFCGFSWVLLLWAAFKWPAN